MIPEDDGKWNHAQNLLTRNPKAMTYRVLITALQQQAPTHIIQLMLKTNIKSASIPKEGPTPLQIAVQCENCCDTISLLLKASPHALCVTNQGHDLDPLSYAKRHLKNSTKLIELLKKPIGFWMNQKKDTQALPSPLDLTSVDRQELNNVKLLCAHTIKEQKKLKNQMTEHFRHQLIALDMKEKAMRFGIKQCHDSGIKQCIQKVTEIEDKMKEWEILLEQEAKINAHFRNDLVEWVEDQCQRPLTLATPLCHSPSKIAAFASVKKLTQISLCRPFHNDRVALEDEGKEESK